MIVFLASIAFVPGWTGFGINPVFPFLAGALAIVLIRRQVPMTTCHWLGVAFLGYAAVSLYWTPEPAWGREKLFELATLGMGFAYGSTLRSLRPAVLGLGLGISVSAVLAAAQSFGFQGIGQTSIPGGLFGNSSILGQCAALALVAVVMERVWWLVPGPALALVLGQSRAAFAAAAIVLAMTKRWWLGLVAFGCLVLVGSNQLMPLREWGLAAAGKAPDIRLEIWGEILRTPSLFGHGLGSFAYSSSLGTALHAHNDFLEFFSELGIGIIPLAVMLVFCLEGECDTGRSVLLAFLVIALFAFPTFVPLSGFVAAVTAGYLSSLRPLGQLAYRNRSIPTLRSV